MKRPVKFTTVAIAFMLAAGGLRISAQAQPPAPPLMGTPPAVKDGLTINKPSAFQGYSLLAPMTSTSTYLIDMEGRIVHEWKSLFTPALSAYLLENGHLLRTGAERGFGQVGPGSGGRIQEFDWDGELVWDYSFGDSKLHPHHDICRLPNGNLLVVASDTKTVEQAVAAGRNPKTIRGQLIPDCLLEIRPVGKNKGLVVWRWHAWDHLVQDFDKTKPNFGDVTEHPELIDLNFTTSMMDRMMNDPQQLARLRSLGYVGGGPAPPNGQNPPGNSKSGIPQVDPAGGRGIQGNPASLTTTSESNGGKSSLPNPTENAAETKSDVNEQGSGGPTPDGRRQGGPRDGDWMHVNSVAYNARLDQIMISVHEFSEIWVIDHSTTKDEAASHSGGHYGKGGDLLYRWGNPRVYRSGTTAEQRLFAQHCAHWIEDGRPGEGHVLLFNNGIGRPDGNYSSVDEFVLPLNSKGLYDKEEFVAYAPERAAWSYSAPEKSDFYSMLISGAQRLPNGNTFICSGNHGLLFEVTPQKEIVWQFKYPPVAPRAGSGDENGPGRHKVAVVPRFFQNILKATLLQQWKIQSIQEEVDARVAKLLTDEQKSTIRTAAFTPRKPKDDDRVSNVSKEARPNGVAAGRRRGRGRLKGGPPLRIGEVLPDDLIEQLELTEAQAAELKQIERYVRDELSKIWTDDQKEQLGGFDDLFASDPDFAPPDTPGDGSGGGVPAISSLVPPEVLPVGLPGVPPGGPRGPGSAGIFRCYRYGADYPGLSGRDLKPGKKLDEVVSAGSPTVEESVAPGK